MNRDEYTNYNPYNDINNDVIALEDEFGTRKPIINSQEKSLKLKAITELKDYNYRTPPKNIEARLKLIFNDPGTHKGYWLYIAQHYTPKSINSAINKILKQHKNGSITIKNPAKYFSYLLRFYKKRKVFRNSNDTYKHQY